MANEHPRTVADVEAADFRFAMSRFASGVNVITVWDGDDVPHGMTATAFCSVSVDPPQVLVCVNGETRTHRLIRASGSFGVSFLGGSSEAISVHCARPGGDKRLDPTWLVPNPASRTPALAGALVHVDCDVVDQHPAGTHTIFVGRVRSLDQGVEEDPLVYFRGDYRRLAAAATR